MVLGLSRRVAGVMLLLAVVLLTPACSKRNTTARTPPPPDYLKLGEGYFEAGDYPNAIKSYSTYLQGGASAPDADRALFRMALAYAVAEGPAQDLPKGMQLLGQLVKEYPASPFKPPAVLLLRLQDDVTKLKADLSKREADLTKRDAELTKRDEKVKELAKELEKLKQIDMGRRPTRVPR